MLSTLPQRVRSMPIMCFHVSSRRWTRRAKSQRLVIVAFSSRSLYRWFIIAISMLSRTITVMKRKKIQSSSTYSDVSVCAVDGAP